MRAVVVIESWFGNTQQVGEAIVRGLAAAGAQVNIVGVEDAAGDVGEAVDLLLLGAPTHNRGLSTPQTRAKAAESAGRPVSLGLREWLEGAVIPSSTKAAVFDTATGEGWMPGSAAKAAAKIIVKKTSQPPVSTKTFVVKGTSGPLRPGDLEAAEAWGRQLASE